MQRRATALAGEQRCSPARCLAFARCREWEAATLLGLWVVERVSGADLNISCAVSCLRCRT